MTYQLIYSSVSAMPMQHDELQALLEHSQDSNGRSGITGALVYADGHFLQILEGEKARVRALMGRIAADLRHTTVGVLREGDVAAPLFSRWQMAYVGATAEQMSQWVGFRTTAGLPAIVANLRESRERTTQLVERILAALLDSGAP